MMFIQNNQTVIDRSCVKLTLLTDTSLEVNKNNSTRYVLAQDAILKSSKFDLSGNFVIATSTDFSISGIGLVIENTGICFDEDKIAFYNGKSQGHLSYIDGCSNTNLIDPFRNGDPCVNYLFFPPNINQTFHTHPSFRIGMIIEGEGYADLKTEEIPLRQGDIFMLPRNKLHRFCTKNQSMSLIVFHPDSEDGPRDEHNPMKSRTYI